MTIKHLRKTHPDWNIWLCGRAWWAHRPHDAAWVREPTLKSLASQLREQQEAAPC